LTILCIQAITTHSTSLLTYIYPWVCHCGWKWQHFYAIACSCSEYKQGPDFKAHIWG